jgi:glycerol-3-phosphate acyltransferase PlsY
LLLHLAAYALASWRQWSALQLVGRLVRLVLWCDVFLGQVWRWRAAGPGVAEAAGALAWLGWIVLVLLFLPLTLLEMLAKQLRRRAVSALRPRRLDLHRQSGAV